MQQIPKIIHYCWFGGKEKPNKIKKCIASWKKNCPGYTIVEWNESNFDVNALLYTKQAYEKKKYAFVSDVARVKALYEQGGIYMDTDVEVFRPFDEILHERCALGFEAKNYVATSFMACAKGHELFREFYESYRNLSFLMEDGSVREGTNVLALTEMLVSRGLERNNCRQTLEGGISVYPQEYFSCYDYTLCVRSRTQRSFCEHKFYVSWLPWRTRCKKTIKKILVAVIGKEMIKKLSSKQNV